MYSIVITMRLCISSIFYVSTRDARSSNYHTFREEAPKFHFRFYIVQNKVILNPAGITLCILSLDLGVAFHMHLKWYRHFRHKMVLLDKVYHQ